MRNIQNNIIDLLRKDFSTAISRFRLRLRKNYSTYTPYMLNNFSFVSLEIRKFRYENLCAVGLIQGVVAGIRLYQKTFSPDHGFFYRINNIQHCCFFPSCSEYAIEALRQYGLVYGIMVSMKRIVRCNPFCTGGYDPVK